MEKPDVKKIREMLGITELKPSKEEMKWWNKNGKRVQREVDDYVRIANGGSVPLSPVRMKVR